MTNADAASIRRRARRATGQFSALVDIPQEPSSGTTWYYSVNGETYGPYAEQELIDRFGDGRVGDEAYVWNEAMIDWKAAVEEPLFAGLIEKARDEKAQSGGRFRTTSLSIADQLVGEETEEPAAASDTASDTTGTKEPREDIDFGWEDSAVTTREARTPHRERPTPKKSPERPKRAGLADPDLQAALNSEAFEDAMGEALDQMFSGNFEAVPDSDVEENDETPTVSPDDEAAKATDQPPGTGGGLRPAEDDGDTVSRLKAKLNARRSRRQTGSMPAITVSDVAKAKQNEPDAVQADASDEAAATTPDWDAITGPAKGAEAADEAAATTPDWDAVTTQGDASGDDEPSPEAAADDVLVATVEEETASETGSDTDPNDVVTRPESDPAEEAPTTEVSDTESFPATPTPPPFIAEQPPETGKAEEHDTDTSSLVGGEAESGPETEENEQEAGTLGDDDVDTPVTANDELDEFEMLALDLTGTGIGEETAANAVVVETTAEDERDERFGNLLLIALIFGLLIGIGTLANAMWGGSSEQQAPEENSLQGQPAAVPPGQRLGEEPVRQALSTRQLENLGIASQVAGDRIEDALQLATGEAEYAANRNSESGNTHGASVAAAYGNGHNGGGRAAPSSIAPGIPSLPGVNTGNYLAERSPQTVIQSGTEQFIRTVVRMCENQVRGQGGVNMSNVRVTLRVRPTGEVEAISLDPGRARSPAFHDCVLRRGTNHRFAPFEGSTQTVNLRNITLTP